MNLESSVPFLILVSVTLVPVFSTEEKFPCRKEGRFPDPYNCASYIECVRIKGALYPRRDYCGKGGFHPKLRKCVPIKELKGCSAREPRLAKNEIRNPDLDHLCVDEKGFLCSDCKTQVHCVDGHAFVKKCKSNDVCTEREEFAGGVCHPDYLEKCSCINSNDFVADPYDLSGFFFCNEFAEPEHYRCSKNTVWDSNLNQCVRPKGAFPPCDRTGSGVFAHKENCRIFYKCINIQGGWLQSDFECGHKQMFSDVNDRCEDPCTWFKGQFTCEKEGRFADSMDCRAYHECVEEDGRFRETKYYCPIDCNWQQHEDGTSGDCVKKEMSQCTEMTPSQCDIPPDWCSDGSLGPPTFEESIFEGQAPQTAIDQGNNQGASETGEPQENPDEPETISGTVTVGEGNEESVGDDVADDDNSPMFDTEDNGEVSNIGTSELDMAEISTGDDLSGSEIFGDEANEDNTEGGTNESNIEETDETNIEEEEEDISNNSDSEITFTEETLDSDASDIVPTNVMETESEDTTATEIDEIEDNSEGNVESNNLDGAADDINDDTISGDLLEDNENSDDTVTPPTDVADTEDVNEEETGVTEDDNIDNQNLDFPTPPSATSPEDVNDTEDGNEEEIGENEENNIDNENLDFPKPPELVDVVVSVDEDDLTGEDNPAVESKNPEEEIDESFGLKDIKNDLSLLNNFYRFKRRSRSRLLEFL